MPTSPKRKTKGQDDKDVAFLILAATGFQVVPENQYMMIVKFIQYPTTPLQLLFFSFPKPKTSYPHT